MIWGLRRVGGGVCHHVTLYLPTTYSTPFATNGMKMVRNGVRASQNQLSVSAPPSVAKNNERTRGTFWMGARLGHKNQLSLVSRA